MMRFLEWGHYKSTSFGTVSTFSSTSFSFLLTDSISVFVFFSPSLPTWDSTGERSPPDDSSLILYLSGYITTSQSFLAIINVPVCGADSITEAQDGLGQLYNELWSRWEIPLRYALYFISEQVQASRSTSRAHFVKFTSIPSLTSCASCSQVT